MSRNQSLLMGLAYLAAAAAAAFFVLWRGVLILVVWGFIRLLEAIFQPEQAQPADIGAVGFQAALLTVVGACLTWGLLDLALRRFSGRPYPSRRSALRFVAANAILIAATALVSWTATTPEPPPPGLAGIWRDAASGQHTYRFNPDGTVTGWSSGWGGRYGTWTRTGQTVTVRAVAGWRFEGSLAGSSIRGSLIDEPSGAMIGPTEWVREVTP